MINLRELKVEDAPLMLEWMHDKDIQNGFKKNMLSATLEDAKNFCNNASIPEIITEGSSIHFAIENDKGEYLGTISLKNISIDNHSAEYAIALRKKVQGHGIAMKATGLLLKKAFSDYKLHRVYLNVFSNNKTAIKLYERCGFTYEGEFREHIRVGDKYMNWKWYGILASEFDFSKY